MPLKFLMTPRSPFLGKRRMQLFFPILFIDCIVKWKKQVIKFPCLPYFWMYFVKACRFSTFDFLNFLSTSSVNYSSLMSTWQLMIFVVTLSAALGVGSEKILEMLFLFLYSFFLAGIFYFYFRVAFPNPHYFYCLPCYSWLFIFYWVSYFGLKCILVLFGQLVFSGLSYVSTR